MEGRLAESLGTRVHIEKKDVGGKILIDFFSYEELQNLLTMLERERMEKSTVLSNIQNSPIAPFIKETPLVVEPAQVPEIRTEIVPEIRENTEVAQYIADLPGEEVIALEEKAPEEKQADYLDDRTKVEVRMDENEDDLYNIKNFSL
jgi:hypothetical protein